MPVGGGGMTNKHGGEPGPAKGYVLTAAILPNS